LGGITKGRPAEVEAGPRAAKNAKGGVKMSMSGPGASLTIAHFLTRYWGLAARRGE